MMSSVFHFHKSYFSKYYKNLEGEVVFRLPDLKHLQDLFTPCRDTDSTEEVLITVLQVKNDPCQLISSSRNNGRVFSLHFDFYKDLCAVASHLDVPEVIGDLKRVITRKQNKLKQVKDIYSGKKNSHGMFLFRSETTRYFQKRLRHHEPF